MPVCLNSAVAVLMVSAPYHLPEQPLYRSLNQLASELNLTFIANFGAWSQSTAPAIAGEMSGFEVIERLMVNYPAYILVLKPDCVISIAVRTGPLPKIDVPKAKWRYS